MSYTRRSFLQGSAVLLASAMPPLATVFAQSTRATGQEPIRLDEGWEFYRGPLDPAFQVWHSDELVTWQKVTVPHCVNHYDACDPDTPAYRGQSWYRRTVQTSNPYRNGRTLLLFQGAGQTASVYIGNKLVATHVGGYDEFAVDITDGAAGAGQVQLAVLCDNGRDTQRMPSDLSDFTLYGGLYRAVSVAYVPPVSLEAVHTDVTWQPGEPASITVTGRLYAPAAPAGPLSVQVSLVGPDGREVFQTTAQMAGPWQGETALARAVVPAPATWSPAAPNLYRCEVTLRHDGQSCSVSHRFGVRHTRWEEHGPFYLNGERLALRGTQRHEDHAGYAAAMPDSLIRDELTMIHAMGANFLRLGHYQQSRVVLDLCDELGILVWEEVPWCRSGVVDEAFKRGGRRQLLTMIDQHRNHPCVLLWGLGNEDDWPGEPNGEDHEATRNYMQVLSDAAHQADPSRLTSYRRCDFARDIPDVYSPSIWAGWYSGAFTEYRSALEKARPTVKHLFHVEWGADSHAGRHAEDADPAAARIHTGGSTAERGFDYKLQGGATRMAKDGEWSETYACDLFDWYLKTLEELPWLTGAAQWAFKDFTTPLRVENPVPRVNQKGLVTRDLQPKEGYFVFQSYWATKPMLRLYGHNWPVRWGRAGQERLVRVYSNCAEVELFHNGRSLGTRRRAPEDFPCAGLRWSVAFQDGPNTLRAVAHGPAGALEDTVTFRYETRAWGKPSQIQLRALAEASGRTTLEAELVDAQGVRCLDSREQVRFSVAGRAQLIDNLGTPGGSRMVQLANGRATIQLTSAGSYTAAVETHTGLVGQHASELQSTLTCVSS